MQNMLNIAQEMTDAVIVTVPIIVSIIKLLCPHLHSDAQVCLLTCDNDLQYSQ